MWAQRKENYALFWELDFFPLLKFVIIAILVEVASETLPLFILTIKDIIYLKYFPSSLK